MRVTTAMASWVMLAPLFWGMAASDALRVLLGCTEKINSMVPLTPSGRRGTRVSIFISSGRSHAGAIFGLIKAFKTGNKFQEPFLVPLSEGFA